MGSAMGAIPQPQPMSAIVTMERPWPYGEPLVTAAPWKPRRVLGELPPVEERAVVSVATASHRLPQHHGNRGACSVSCRRWRTMDGPWPYGEPPVAAAPWKPRRVLGELPPVEERAVVSVEPVLQGRGGRAALATSRDPLSGTCQPKCQPGRRWARSRNHNPCRRS
jgi:hypothetical protein